MARRITLLALAVAALLPSTAVPQTQPVTVLSIGDGDTLRVQVRGRS